VNAGDASVAQKLWYDVFGQVSFDPGFQPFGYAGGLYDPNTGSSGLGHGTTTRTSGGGVETSFGNDVAYTATLGAGAGTVVAALALLSPLFALEMTGGGLALNQAGIAGAETASAALSGLFGSYGNLPGAPR
jgi:hypothetical protein